ncbi:DUF2666 domain-containing protein [Candidatus Micrarchaeota archaeon]|nr:DUF2666 domain-containing protein [Candidatus Micrarchaeota archaeon]
MDEMIFSGRYKDWNHSVIFNLSNASEKDVACALAQLHEVIDSSAFCHAGINCAMIENLAKEGNGIQDAAKFFESRKPGEWKSALLKTVDNEALLPVAESKLVCAAFTKNKVRATISCSMIDSSIKPSKSEELEGQIALIARYKNWIAIKKMSVDSTTKDYEVAGILAAINATIVKKAFDFCKPNKEMEKIAAEATKGKRKSFQNLADALRTVASNIGKNQIDDAYLVKCVSENLKFIPYANVDSLITAHPDLKMAKPRGRVAKG